MTINLLYSCVLVYVSMYTGHHLSVLQLAALWKTEVAWLHISTYIPLCTGHQRICTVGGGGDKEYSNCCSVVHIYIPLCTQGINMSILGVAAVRKTTIGLL